MILFSNSLLILLVNLFENYTHSPELSFQEKVFFLNTYFDQNLHRHLYLSRISSFDLVPLTMFIPSTNHDQQNEIELSLKTAKSFNCLSGTLDVGSINESNFENFNYLCQVHEMFCRVLIDNKIQRRFQNENEFLEACKKSHEKTTGDENEILQSILIQGLVGRLACQTVTLVDGLKMFLLHLSASKRLIIKVFSPYAILIELIKEKLKERGLRDIVQVTQI